MSETFHKHLSYYNTDEKVQAYVSKDKAWAKLTKDILTDLLKGLPEKGRVLDAGCGYGRDVSVLRALGYDAIGVDQSASMVKMAVETYGPYFHPLPLKSLKELNEQFDIVHCRNVLVHVTHDELTETLEEVYSSIKPGGTLILISKSGTGASITHTTGEERETLLHDKDHIADILLHFGGTLMEAPWLLPSVSANGDRLFCMRVQKPSRLNR